MLLLFFWIISKFSGYVVFKFQEDDRDVRCSNHDDHDDSLDDRDDRDDCDDRDDRDERDRPSSILRDDDFLDFDHNVCWYDTDVDVSRNFDNDDGNDNDDDNDGKDVNSDGDKDNNDDNEIGSDRFDKFDGNFL